MTSHTLWVSDDMCHKLRHIGLLTWHSIRTWLKSSRGGVGGGKVDDKVFYDFFHVRHSGI